jgi:DNA-binding response OmpR family regulator
LTSEVRERHGEQILVVEDDRAMLAMLTDVLRANGYAPVATGDPREALALLATDPFDLVIADIVMPYLDGVGLLEKTKERHPGTEVLLITAFGTEAVVREAREKGAAGFLRKPFDLGMLMAEVRDILARRARAAGAGAVEQEALCYVCKKPFERGEGRYRLKEGDAHGACAKSRTACPTCGATLKPQYASGGLLVALACPNSGCGYYYHFPM